MPKTIMHDLQKITIVLCETLCQVNYILRVSWIPKQNNIWILVMWNFKYNYKCLEIRFFWRIYNIYNVCEYAWSSEPRIYFTIHIRKLKIKITDILSWNYCTNTYAWLCVYRKKPIYHIGRGRHKFGTISESHYLRVQVHILF